MKASNMLSAGLAHAFAKKVDATSLATSSAARDCNPLRTHIALARTNLPTSEKERCGPTLSGHELVNTVCLSRNLQLSRSTGSKCGLVLITCESCA